MLVFDRCGEQEDGRWAAWPKLSTLAEDAGISSVATIRKHLVVLSEADIIEREARFTSRGQTSNRIVLRVPEADTMESSPLPPERATAQPAPTGAGGTLPPERAYVRKPQGNPQEEKERARDPRQLPPDDFPAILKPHARHVMRVLATVAEQHGARKVWPLAVGRVVMAHPRHPLVATAHALAAWAVDPPRKVVDVVGTYRTFLAKERELEAVERLADDGTPTGAVRQHPPGVTPIHAAGRYDARAAKAQREAEREAAAMRVLSLQQEGIT